jgi:hypothetical protein
MADAKSVTLVASTAQTITLNADYQHLEITNVSGTSPVYFTVAALEATITPATVAGNGCGVVGGVADAHRELDGSYDERGIGQVSVISSGTPTVTVRGW